MLQILVVRLHRDMDLPKVSMLYWISNKNVRLIILGIAAKMFFFLLFSFLYLPGRTNRAVLEITEWVKTDHLHPPQTVDVKEGEEAASSSNIFLFLFMSQFLPSLSCRWLCLYCLQQIPLPLPVFGFCFLRCCCLHGLMGPITQICGW